uniref:Phosphate:H symporter (Phosphate:H symporter, variant) n=1 Tax=Ganoderma boninense TaxID=34458 RepID=A0A5K1K1J3_9APHY|nr:Phosphate:H symporter (Phosphate:H symporter, variant) [Ganoderma boninense]
MVASVQARSLLALGVVSLFFSQISALSIPAPRNADSQTPFLPPQSQPKYTTGLLPPLRNTVGWVDPRLNGGQFLDYTTDTLGEPLNIIISSESDPDILTESGMQTYIKSIGFSRECLGLHYGHIHDADLGDGPRTQAGAVPWAPALLPYHRHLLGIYPRWTSLPASQEMDSSKNHMIVDDGYNRGRNYIVERATAGSHWRGTWWKAEVQWQDGLLESGNRGVNHGIEQDGLVAILTVHRL